MIDLHSPIDSPALDMKSPKIGVSYRFFFGLPVGKLELLSVALYGSLNADYPKLQFVGIFEHGPVMHLMIDGQSARISFRADGLLIKTSKPKDPKAREVATAFVKQTISAADVARLCDMEQQKLVCFLPNSRSHLIVRPGSGFIVF